MKKVFLYASISIFISAVIACAYIANYFCSTLSLGSDMSGSSVYAVAEECFIVCLNKSQSRLEAETISGDCLDTGSSGYIFNFDGYFYVVHSACEKQNDSFLVTEHLKKRGIPSEVLCLSFPKIFIEEELSQEKRNLLQDVLNSFFSSFRYLCDLAVGTATNTYPTKDVSEKLQKLSTKIELLQKKFATNFDIASPRLLAIGEYLADEVECVMLAHPTEKDLNYRAIELIDIYRNMCTELA